MYIIDVQLCDKKISSSFMVRYKDVQKFVMDWSKNKHEILGYRVPFNDFQIFVYDVSKPCSSHHIEKPMHIYY